MNGVEVTPDVLARLRALATVLVPSKDDKPGAGDLHDLDKWLARAIHACGYDDHALETAIGLLPPAIDSRAAGTLAAEEPEAFAMLSTLASAAYFMAPEVLQGFGFPDDRRNPAGVEDFMAEFETGIFEPMLARGPMFRDPRTEGK